MDGILKKVYGYVGLNSFYGMINRAKEEKVFVDESGWVDVGHLVEALVDAYSENTLNFTTPPKNIKAREHSKRFDYREEISTTAGAPAANLTGEPQESSNAASQLPATSEAASTPEEAVPEHPVAKSKKIH